MNQEAFVELKMQGIAFVYSDNGRLNLDAIGQHVATIDMRAWFAHLIKTGENHICDGVTARIERSDEAAVPPTREIYDAVVPLTCPGEFEWPLKAPYPVWCVDSWRLDIDTVAKLRAACLLLGIDWPEEKE